MKQRRLKKLASPARNLSIHGAASTDPTVTSDTIPVVNPVTKEEVMMGELIRLFRNRGKLISSGFCDARFKNLRPICQ